MKSLTCVTRDRPEAITVQWKGRNDPGVAADPRCELCNQPIDTAVFPVIGTDGYCSSCAGKHYGLGKLDAGVTRRLWICREAIPVDRLSYNANHASDGRPDTRLCTMDTLFRNRRIRPRPYTSLHIFAGVVVAPLLCVGSFAQPPLNAY